MKNEKIISKSEALTIAKEKYGTDIVMIGDYHTLLGERIRVKKEENKKLTLHELGLLNSKVDFSSEDWNRIKEYECHYMIDDIKEWYILRPEIK